MTLEVSEKKKPLKDWRRIFSNVAEHGLNSVTAFAARKLLNGFFHFLSDSFYSKVDI